MCFLIFFHNHPRRFLIVIDLSHALQFFVLWVETLPVNRLLRDLWVNRAWVVVPVFDFPVYTACEGAFGSRGLRLEEARVRRSGHIRWYDDTSLSHDSSSTSIRLLENVLP